MSKLISNYEISVWEDYFQDGKFIEKKICVIGSDEMDYQGRAIEASFIKKANGEKKLTFSMYKRYIDNITGELVINPFCDFLVNERKVKLYYKEKWYDFVVKNVEENSSTYLYKYSLEDALVQELSKNGFDFVFDENAMNNLGTAKELGEKALVETDWEVESDFFTETVKENLVYLLTTKEQKVIHLLSNNEGDITSTEEINLPKNTKVLGFYSCCKNQPHRFQFIYLDKEEYNDYDLNLINIDSERVILETSCQYYFDVETPSVYQEVDNYFLPPGFTLAQMEEATSWDDKDTLVSNWYKGKRYSFALITEYVPLLERYCNHYKKDTEEYYGYLHVDFASPLYTNNIFVNTEFDGITGWKGGYLGETPFASSTYSTTITPVFGRFDNNSFVDAETSLKNGNFDPSQSQAFLKLSFPQEGLSDKYNTCFVMNTGFYDHIKEIGEVAYGDKWRLNLGIYLNNGEKLSSNEIINNFSIFLQEVQYNPSLGIYQLLGDPWGTSELENGQLWIKITSQEELSPKELQKRKINIIIMPTSSFASNITDGYVYLSNPQMYKQVLNENGEEIVPGEFNTEGVMVREYHFIKKEDIKKATSVDEVRTTKIDADKIDYTVYVPQYTGSAEKVRTIAEKESNYFNILQKIAETFEAWLELSVTRDPDSPGRILTKTVKFKKYLGKENYAAFRYGVNLKDIKRTYESKALVSKLIVKDNSNELAEGGYCSIGSANSNPTGEKNIYDFRYFHNMGLLPEADYMAQLYYPKNPYTGVEQQGVDIDESQTTTNLQNYFNRIKSINNKIGDIVEVRGNLTNELIDLQADKEVQDATVIAATESIKQIQNDFFALTGFYPNEIGENPFSRVEIDEINPPTINSWNVKKPTIELSPKSGTEQNTTSLDWYVQVDFLKNHEQDDVVDVEIPTEISENDEADATDYLVPMGGIQATWLTDTSFRFIKQKGTAQYGGVAVSPKEGYQDGHRYTLSYKITVTQGSIDCIGSHQVSFYAFQISLDGGKTWSSKSNRRCVLSKGETCEVQIRGTFLKKKNDSTPYLFIQPARGSLLSEDCTCTISNIKMQEFSIYSLNREQSFNFNCSFNLFRDGQEVTTRTTTVKCPIRAYHFNGNTWCTLSLIDTTQGSLQRLLTEYISQQRALTIAQNKLDNSLNAAVAEHENRLEQLSIELNKLSKQKGALNQLFYSTYSNFIREGTWVDEEYIDNDKYYNDALSVLYESCFPKVAYSINVLSINAIPGFECFVFELGDKTYAEDPDFFGFEEKVEVVVTEQTFLLDSPEKDSIKVQTFKNQFQDLFQKITATVQQTKYNTGSYEKAVSLVKGDAQKKGAFITDALALSDESLSIAGQTSVVSDSSGITLTDSNTRNQMRLIGGAILMGIQDKTTGERVWKTGLTPDGITASLITAGTLNAGEITIMNGSEPVFRWDAYGISAFDVDGGQDTEFLSTNPYKFVRFDRHGIYGIDSEPTDEDKGTDGRSWKPASIDEIDELATFALTWEGLKVTSPDGAIARLGRTKEDGTIFQVLNNNKEETFGIDKDGNTSMSGSIVAENGKIGPFEIGKLTITNKTEQGETFTKEISSLIFNVYRESSSDQEHFMPVQIDERGITFETNWYLSIMGFSPKVVWGNQEVKNSSFVISGENSSDIGEMFGSIEATRLTLSSRRYLRNESGDLSDDYEQSRINLHGKGIYLTGDVYLNGKKVVIVNNFLKIEDET